MGGRGRAGIAGNAGATLGSSGRCEGQAGSQSEAAGRDQVGVTEVVGAH